MQGMNPEVTPPGRRKAYVYGHAVYSRGGEGLLRASIQPRDPALYVKCK